MNLLLGTIKTYIGSYGLGTVSGSNVDVFLGTMPSDPISCISVLPTGGPYDPNNKVRKIAFQVLVRGTSVNSVTTRVDSLHALLTDVWNRLCPIRGRILPAGEPGMIGRDAQNNVVFTSNYVLHTTEIVL